MCWCSSITGLPTPPTAFDPSRRRIHPEMPICASTSSSEIRVHALIPASSAHIYSANTLQGRFGFPPRAYGKGASLQRLLSVRRNRLQWCPSHPRWHFTFAFTFDLQHCWLTAVKRSAQQSGLLMSLMTFALVRAHALNIAASKARTADRRALEAFSHWIFVTRAFVTTRSESKTMHHK